MGEGYEDEVVLENINRVVLPAYYELVAAATQGDEKEKPSKAERDREKTEAGKSSPPQGLSHTSPAPFGTLHCLRNLRIRVMHRFENCIRSFNSLCSVATGQ